MKKKRIYIAGPYWNEDPAIRLKNTLAAVDAGIRVMAEGHLPFIPHLFHFFQERARETGFKFTETDFLGNDLAWLMQCDEMLFLGPSRGASLERRLAEVLGMPVTAVVDREKLRKQAQDLANKGALE